MKTKILIILISLLSIGLSNAQEEPLFLLVGHPFYDAEPFPSHLLRLNYSNKSLEIIRRFSTSKESLREVKYYPELRKIIIVKDGWILTENTHKVIQFLDMDNGQEMDSVSLDSLNYSYMYSWLFSFNNTNKSVFCIQLANHRLSKKSILIGIQMPSLRSLNVDPNDFIYTEISGNPGSCLLTFDGLDAYTNSRNGQLRIPKTADTLSRPVFPIQLPKEFQFQKKERRLIIVNTKNIFAFSLYNSPTDAKNIGYSDLAILDKSSNSWYKQKIKGNCDGMIRSFGEWIAGTVFSNNNIFDEKDRLKEKIVRLSPGKEKRRKKMTKTGMPADYRFEYFGVYSPGILYILNVHTKHYIEWSTGQGDSEILLIENDLVYYRVNDEIYRAPILNGQRLGKTRLLIKNEIVPDIHWAFISNN